jgi:hypothetical protein
MRGYPKGPLKKVDYENLLSMPEYVEKAKSDLARLAIIDDDEILINQGTEEKPILFKVTNLFPIWKQMEFQNKAELIFASTSEGEAIPIKKS